MSDQALQVLLVGDDATEHRRVQDLLAEARFDRFEVEWASTWDQATDLLRQDRHAVCLVDHRLENRPGLDLVREMVREGTTTPLIVLTETADDDQMLDALLAGSADYLDRRSLDSLLLERTIRHAVDRRHTYQELRRNEERFRVLVENLSDAIALVDRDGTVLYVSRSISGILGYAPEALIGRNLFALMHPEDRPQAMRRYSECLLRPGDQAAAEFRYRDVAGGWVHLEVLMVNRLEEAAVRSVVTTIRNVSGRKENERDLRDRERQFRALFDSALDAMVLVSDDRRFLDANPAASQLFRAPREHLLSQVLDRFCPPEVPIEERWTAFIEAGEFKGHLTLVVSPNQRRQVEVSARAHVLPGRHLLVARDITERAELEARLNMAAKMEAVGRLAGGIAHDFNNLLTAILGSSEILALEMPPGEGREDVEEIRRAATRAASLTQQLLAFSRRQVLNPKLLDLNEVVGHTRRMLDRLIGEDIELITRLAPGLGPVKADPVQVEQILLNLAINSRDAMPEGGQLIIATANSDPPQEWNNPPLNCVEFMVRDTGHGMTEEVRARIFEPFFTTKEMGKGTGLGLATVYGIVKQSGGYITVESSPGEGTTFRVYFPRVEGVPDSVTPRSPSGTTTRGSETILLVEDEAAVRRLARKVLRGQGHTVLEAANGRDALRVAAQHRGPLHLMVTDVVMPGMSGPELAGKLGQDYPGLQVLYISGYADEAIGHHGILEPGINFLQKPFTPQELMHQVRKALDTAEAGGRQPEVPEGLT